MSRKNDANDAVRSSPHPTGYYVLREIFRTSKYVWSAIVWGAIILAACPAFPQSLDNYCISQTGQRPQSNLAPQGNQAPRLTVSSGSKKFYVIVSDSRGVLELEDENNNSIKKVMAWQWWDDIGHIDKLIMGKNGWLWIGGSVEDYMAQLDLSTTPPTLNNPVRMPELTGFRCDLLAWLFGFRRCAPATGYYSSTLDRSFITGYPKKSLLTLLGLSSRISYEVEAGKAKPLSMDLGDWIAELPNLHGILFRGTHDEAIFYDGNTFTSVLDNYLKLSLFDTTPRWHAITTPITKRIFLTNTSHAMPFFVELKPGNRLSSISRSNEISDSWFLPYEFPMDWQLFGVAPHAVVAEVEGALRTIVIIPTPSYTYASVYMGQTPNDAIAFTVVQSTLKASTDYFIVRASPSANCIAYFNLDKPIILGE